MSTLVNAGRFTARTPPAGAAVFLIGMRVNTPLRPDIWWPAAMAMPRMLRYLMNDQANGLLGFHSWFGRTTLILSYWRDADDIERFARDPNAPHAPAWKKFNNKLGRGGHVGIWHETYVIEPGNHESVYRDMPPFGLGAATHADAVGAPGTNRWRERLATRPVAGRPSGSPGHAVPVRLEQLR